MERIHFANLPSQTTPINAENLNKMQDNVEQAISENTITILNQVRGDIDTTISKNTNGTIIYNNLSQVKSDLDWETATTNNVFAAMSNNSMLMTEVPNGSKIVTDLGLSNGAVLIIHKITAWRGFAQLSVYASSTFKIAHSSGNNELTWKTLNVS